MDLPFVSDGNNENESHGYWFDGIKKVFSVITFREGNDLLLSILFHHASPVLTTFL